MDISVRLAGDLAISALNNACSGNIQSVFEHTINLIIPVGGSVSSIHLAIMENDAHPYGLTCPGLSHHSGKLKKNGFTVRDGILRTGDYCFPYNQATILLQTRHIDTPERSHNLFPALSLLGQILSRFHKEKCRSEGNAWRKLNDKIQGAFPVVNMNEPAVPSMDPLPALKELLGYGPGLTPAGDDFISGYLVSYALLADGWEKRKYEEWGAVLADMDTTVFSQSQIRYAGQAICLHSIYRLIKCLCSEMAILQETENVLRIGATSGWAWAMGIYAALKTKQTLFQKYDI